MLGKYGRALHLALMKYTMAVSLYQQESAMEKINRKLQEVSIPDEEIHRHSLQVLMECRSYSPAMLQVLAPYYRMLKQAQEPKYAEASMRQPVVQIEEEITKLCHQHQKKPFQSSEQVAIRLMFDDEPHTSCRFISTDDDALVSVSDGDFSLTADSLLQFCITSQGHIYSREHIERWITSRGVSAPDPLTKQRISARDLHVLNEKNVDFDLLAALIDLERTKAAEMKGEAVPKPVMFAGPVQRPCVQLEKAFIAKFDEQYAEPDGSCVVSCSIL